jgi:hypothetical protein
MSLYPFSFYFFIFVLGGGTLWLYKGSYNVSTISYLNSPLPLLLFIPQLTIHGTFSTGIIFAKTCMRTHFFCIIVTLLSPFLTTSPLPLVPTLSPEQDLFCPPVLRFCRRRKIKRKTTFLLL